MGMGEGEATHSDRKPNYGFDRRCTGDRRGGWRVAEARAVDNLIRGDVLRSTTQHSAHITVSE
jgi:hypothetical protein